MVHFFRSRVLGVGRGVVGGVLLSCVLWAGPASAESETPAEDPSPFAVITAAGVNRALQDLAFVLESAGQAERMEEVRGVLHYLNGLEGIDRRRPLGLMLYLPEEPPHEAESILVLPLSGIDELDETVSRIEELSLQYDEAGRVQVRGPDASFDGIVQGEWLYLAEDADWLERPLTEIAGPGGFDVLLTVNRDGIPPAVIDEAVDKLHADMESDLVRREEEAAAEHQLRVRISRLIGRFLERLITDVEEVSVGLTISETSRDATLEARLSVSPESPLAATFGGLSAPSSQFVPLADETAALTVRSSWKLSGEPAEVAADLLAHIRAEVTRDLDRPIEQLGRHPFERMLTAASRTIDAGRMDGVLQFVNAPDDRFVLVAAAHVESAEVIAGALQEIVRHVEASPEGRLLDANISTVAGVPLHRMRLEDLRRQDRRLYGDAAALYFGAGADAVWIAVGGTTAESTLSRMIRASTAARESASEKPPAPQPVVSATLHLSNWLRLADGDATESERGWLKAARTAFSDADEDTLSLELFADESGLRLTMHAEHGYLRLLGLVLTARMDRSDAAE